ncbi:uncharacterized protein PHALS_01072 [Plasmopara halstedii]|uniref:Uncharacterized protein n=1 Tax=Plasmopara halstedii TaxID=4781 RepID=A0A0P1ATS6_PLAHL|nr:uncharacterized protein PHALS_01072 [Plasmopara halstedii]CEG44732.1 hypothetical protein PHALS_01072 [Plasmopara halstedii]|eukprot:XP_024581101.1 hypothetical protein PHALS_01072 [Plasmopara halstedii]
MKDGKFKSNHLSARELESISGLVKSWAYSYEAMARIRQDEMLADDRAVGPTRQKAISDASLDVRGLHIAPWKEYRYKQVRIMFA